jgi:hypothetical protein
LNNKAPLRIDGHTNGSVCIDPLNPLCIEK